MRETQLRILRDWYYEIEGGDMVLVIIVTQKGVGEAQVLSFGLQKYPSTNNGQAQTCQVAPDKWLFIMSIPKPLWVTELLHAAKP